MEALREMRGESDRVGDEGDRQVEAKRKRMLFSMRAEEQRQWVVGMTQVQGSKIKSILVGRTKSRHEYLEGKCSA